MFIIIIIIIIIFCKYLIFNEMKKICIFLKKSCKKIWSCQKKVVTLQYKNKTNVKQTKQQTTMTIINIIFAVLSSLCALTFLVSSLISTISKNEKYETIANNSAINMCIYMFLWIAIISIF